MTEQRDTSWIGIQKRTFTRWVNQHLSDRAMKIEDLTEDLSDGLALINLLEIISDKKLPNYNKKAKIRPQMLENNSFALNFLKHEGIKLVAIGPEDIVDKQPKLILGLIWTIILRYQIQKGDGSSSAKNELLEWVRRQIPECDIQNFTTSWNDGKAICHLADSLKRGILDLNAVDNNPNPLANAQLGEATAERELGIPQLLAPEDMVAAHPDELSVMTYISYYRDYAENEAKRRGQEALEKIAVPEKSFAHGAGLQEGEQFIPAEFTIQARNQFGRDVPCGGETFDVKITTPKGTPVANKVTDNGNGTYTVQYTPMDSGRHAVAIQLKGKAISGSPYHVPIEKTSVSASGPGLEKGEQYLTSEFTVNARKLKDAGVDVPENELAVTINAAKSSPQATIQNNGDGTYTVTYLPTEAGRHGIAVTLFNRPIANGPFSVPIDKTACTASGPGLEKGEQFLPAEFTIQAKNLFNSGNPASGSEFDVKINGPKSPITPIVVDNNDGTYSVSYTPNDTGRHTINISLRGQPISNGPFAPIVDRTSASASGPGLETGEQFVPAVFTVAAKALFDNGSPLAANEVDVRIQAPAGNLQPSIVDNNDGTFTVTYNPIDAGRHQVAVAIKGQPIAAASVPINKSGITVGGPGLEKGEQYIPSNFTINAKPLKEKGVAPDANDFKVNVGGPEGPIPAEVKDNGDGTYDVTFVPQAPGRHNVGVTLKDKPLYTTSVPVDKSATDPSKCTASGPGLEPGNEADKPTHFTIQARNKVGDPMKTGGDPFKVKITGPHKAEVEPKVTDNKDGTYRVEYEPHLVGPHVVEVTLKDQGIQGNPWDVLVERNKDAADPSQTVAYGPGLEGGDTADPSNFTVETRNSAGERLNRGGDPIGVEVFDPSGVEAKVTVQDNNDGTYSVTYQAVNPGNHRVDVVLRNKKYPIYYDHIKDSPFTVPVTAGTDPSKSLVYGPGLSDAFDTKPAEFHIKARDRDGNDMNRGGDPFEVVVTGPSGEVPSNIKDNGDGTYDVVYEPIDHGDHKIEVKLRGKPVANSPYKVAVKEGADYNNTFVEQYSFVIRSQTKQNKPKTFGGEKFEVTIDSGSSSVEPNIKDIGDGTYVVSYSLPQPGDYTIGVKINGKHIRGSPWKQVQN